MRFDLIWHGLFGGLTRDARGSIAVVFSLSLPVLLLCVGGAIDFLRWQDARSVTGAAIDSAVLAAGRSLIMNPQDSAGAVTAANTVYRSGVAHRIATGSDTIRFVVDDSTGGYDAYFADTDAMASPESPRNLLPAVIDTSARNSAISISARVTELLDSWRSKG